jgi:hypothetical protein
MTNLLNSLLTRFGAKSIALRLVMIVITSFWFAFLPIYLCIIYMLKEGFFSYDFFVDGVFGLKTFVFVFLAFIALLSISLWGFLLLWKKPNLSEEAGKQKKMRIVYGVCAVVWSLLLHYGIYELAKAAGDKKILGIISSIGFVFIAFCVMSFRKPWEAVVLDWKAPVVAVLLSATIPLILGIETAAFIGYALKNFGVGGGVLAKVYANDDYKNIVFCGPLLLLTPKNAYFRDGSRQYRLIVITDRISISAKKNHEAKEMDECREMFKG